VEPDWPGSQEVRGIALVDGEYLRVRYVPEVEDERRCTVEGERLAAGIGTGRLFLAVLLAVCLGGAMLVFVFAPERLPSGVGLAPIPMDLSLRSALFDNSYVAILRNPSGSTLHNVRIACKNAALCQEKCYLEEKWAPGRTTEIGWAEGWRFLPGETLTVSASGFAARTWTVGR